MEKIGKYEVLQKIGEGGFGVVYLGRDPFLKRLVAIKTLSTDLPELRDRFYREAEVAGRLQHPNITNVYDFGFHGQTPYLVQEYLQGEDLDELISRRTQLGLLAKVEILVQAAQGLEYAHQQGVVHRDIKPANLRLVGGRHLKVMDFGIAKLKGVASQLTRTGMTLGTAAYLPPEQLRGEAVDQRADIFSFGATAYEILAGRRPFEGKSVHRLFFQIIQEEPPPIAELVYDCPELLASLVHRCLRKRADERYPSFTPIISDLLAIRECIFQREGGDSWLELPSADPGETTIAGVDPTALVAGALAAAPDAQATRRAASAAELDALRSKAQSQIAKDALEEARATLRTALALAPGDPELQSNLAAVEGEIEGRRDARRRREKLVNTIVAVDRELAAGNLAGAAELLAEAQLELGDDVGELGELRSRLETERARRRRERAGAVASTALRALDSGDLHRSAAALDELTMLDPDHPDLPVLRRRVAGLAAQTHATAEPGPEDTAGGLSALPSEPVAEAALQGLETWLSDLGQRLGRLPQNVLIAFVVGLVVMVLLLTALLL